MIIPNKYHHYDTLEQFRAKKLSASPDDDKYTYGGDGEVYTGEPEISWRSIFFIKDVRFFGTHGRVYNASGISQGFDTPILLNGTSFDGKSDCTTDLWGTARKITLTSGANTSEVEGINGGSDIILPLPEALDAKVTMDSLGRKIDETYPTKTEMADEITMGLKAFNVYSGDDDTDPTLTTLPASEWTTQEDKELHAGDFYVTTEGRVFQFTEPTSGAWEWTEITDYYLYNCLDELRKLKQKVDISGTWDKVPQTTVESGHIDSNGTKETRPYLDVLCCPGYVNYKLTDDTNLYFPFSCGSTWVRTSTKYFRDPRLVRAVDLFRIAGKTIVITNQSDSEGQISLLLGSSPAGSSTMVTLLPGKSCIVTLHVEVIDGIMACYWTSSVICELGNMYSWA